MSLDHFELSFRAGLNANLTAFWLVY
jgi:hypothetical protein